MILGCSFSLSLIKVYFHYKKCVYFCSYNIIVKWEWRCTHEMFYSMISKSELPRYVDFLIKINKLEKKTIRLHGNTLGLLGLLGCHR